MNRPQTWTATTLIALRALLRSMSCLGPLSLDHDYMVDVYINVSVWIYASLYRIVLEFLILRIVTARKRQRNFQLIVITHDEEFLDKLHRTCGVANYYRVAKDQDT
jgi:hypothetical protein